MDKPISLIIVAITMSIYHINGHPVSQNADGYNPSPRMQPRPSLALGQSNHISSTESTYRYPLTDEATLNRINVDNVADIMKYLTFEDNTKITRKLNRKFNDVYTHQYNDTISTLSRLQSLFDRIHNASAHQVKGIVKEIGLLHGSNNFSLWLNKDYLLAMPQMFNKFHQKYHSVSYSILSAMCWWVNDSEMNTKECNGIADVHEALVFLSRRIAEDLIFGTTEPTDSTETNANVLLFNHCWELLSKGPNATLPEYDLIFDHNAELVNSSKFRDLWRLIRDFNLIPIHPQYLRRKWKNCQLSDAMKVVDEIQDINPFIDGDNYNNEYLTKARIKTLESIGIDGNTNIYNVRLIADYSHIIKLS